MPLYKNHISLAVKSLRAFLLLEAGVTRGEIPDPERMLQQAQARAKQQEQQVRQLREQLTQKNRALEQLRRQSAVGAPVEVGQKEQNGHLRAEFEKRGPWVTKFVIDGEEHGGNFNAMQDTRIEQFFESFPKSQRIMELGSLEGGHSFSLASRPSVSAVLGIEGREANVEKAKFVQQLLEVRNVEFVTANLEKTDLASYGGFDAVFCSGLLYHLPRPWELVEQISKVSPNLFMWTHYTKEEEVNTTEHGLPGYVYKELGLADPLSGMSPDSFWPTLEGLQDMLKEYGFDDIHLIEDVPDHPQGPAITLAASAS